MTEPPGRQIQITLYRIGKPARTFIEGMVDDNGARLKTHSILSADISRGLSGKYKELGRLPEHCFIHSVSKYYFYKEYFSLVEFRDEARKLLGHYCDLVTPLHRQGAVYSLTDLLLDLWVTPEAGLQELDRDEFEAAVAAGLITYQDELAVRRTSQRLKSEWEAGIFPFDYVE